MGSSSVELDANELGTDNRPGNGLSKVLGRVEVAATWLAAIVVVLITALPLVDVVLVRFMGRISPGVVEGVGLLMVLVVFLTWSNTQREREHICFTLVVSRLTRGAARAAEAVGLAIMGAAFMILTYQSGAGALWGWRMNEISTGYVPIPIWPFRLAVVVGVAMLCARVLIQIREAFTRPSAAGTRGEHP